MNCSAVQCSAVQFSAVECSMMKSEVAASVNHQGGKNSEAAVKNSGDTALSTVKIMMCASCNVWSSM